MMQAARTRSTPSIMADKKQSLLSIIEGAARSGRVCPSLGRLAALLRLGPNTIHDLLESLRNANLISWHLVYAFGGVGGRVRVVTIKATGAKTAMPGKSAKQRRQPAKPGPIFIGPPVRDLRTEAPAEFQRLKSIYEARDAVERAKASA